MEPKTAPQTVTKSVTKMPSKSVTKTAPKSVTKTTPQPVTKTAPKSVTKSVTKPPSKSVTKTAPKTVTKSVTKSVTKTVSNPPSKTAPKSFPKSVTKMPTIQSNLPISFQSQKTCQKIPEVCNLVTRNFLENSSLVSDFDAINLKVSTSTIMVYTNMEFDRNRIIEEFDPVCPKNLPLTRKKKNVDKKKIVCDYGSCISIQTGNRFKGLYMKKTKAKWCTNCQLTKTDGNGMEEKMFTLSEQIYRRSPRKNLPTRMFETPVSLEDIYLDLKVGRDFEYEIMYYCSNCNQLLTESQLSKIPNMLNQTTIELSLGKQPYNIMFFKNSFKIPGCKSLSDAIELIMILWKYYLGISTIWKMSKSFEHENPRFVFDSVMINVDFRLGFPIDRSKLHCLMNSEEYSNVIKMSQFEPTTHANVNIKFFSPPPSFQKFVCLEFSKDRKFKNIQESVFEILGNPYSSSKGKTPKQETTMIVFSSSVIIMSGKYVCRMKEAYDFFLNVVSDRKSDIEVLVSKPQMSLDEYIQRQK